MTPGERQAMKPFKIVTWGCDTAREVGFYDSRQQVEELIADMKDSHLHIEVWRWDDNLGGRVDVMQRGWGEE